MCYGFLVLTADASSIVPYVVPNTYPIRPEVARELGHGVYVTLVRDLDWAVTELHADDLEELGVGSIEEAWQRAYESIDDVFGERIQAWMHDEDPEAPLIHVTGHWLAASCIVLPRLFGWASRALKSEEVLVSIPRRESLVMFAPGDAATRARMRSKIRSADGDAPKRITFELFSLTAAGVAPFYEPAAG